MRHEGLCLQPSFSSAARLQLRAPRRAHPRHLTPPVCVQNGVAPAASAAGSSGGSAVVRQAELAQLRDPAKASGEGTTSIAVQDYGGDVSLSTYMRLPAECYSALDPSMIRPLPDGAFLLSLQPVSLFHVWVAPQVEVAWAQDDDPPRVVLTSRACRLPGSAFFQELEGRFKLHFCLELTWQPGAAASRVPAGASEPASSPAAPPAARAAGAGLARAQQAQQLDVRQQIRDILMQELVVFLGGRRREGGPQPSSSMVGGGSGPGKKPLVPGLHSVGAAAGAASALAAGAAAQQEQQQAVGTGEITGRLSVDVWAETVPPFHLLPRGVVEGTVSAVMRSLVGALLPVFMNELGEDYQKWATDAAYRGSRAQQARQA